MRALTNWLARNFGRKTRNALRKAEEAKIYSVSCLREYGLPDAYFG